MGWQLSWPSSSHSERQRTKLPPGEVRATVASDSRSGSQLAKPPRTSAFLSLETRY